MSGAFYPVIPAGGSGTRLWPLSRAGHPKFLHPLTGGDRTLIQETMDRLRSLSLPGDTFVVTGAAHAAAVARQLPEVPASNIVVEPGPKESGPAIALAAALIQRRDPDAVMGSFAADHVVRDVRSFVSTVKTAIKTAADHKLVCIGITPTHPETGYGYIRCGDYLPTGAREVLEFKEKPTADVAKQYVDSGEYVWNAGMFVWRVDALLAEVERQLPDLYSGLMKICESWDLPRRDEVLAEVWPRLPKISIDHGIMEDAAAREQVAVVPGGFGWNDLGDWDTLGAVLEADADGNVVVGSADRIITVDTTGSMVVPSASRTVALLGMRDVVVVDTPDALLVCPRDRAQEVKKLVEALRNKGASNLC
ncbi:mannose-1-phosphate guanylyltransferase [Cryptosporangium sp. NPDC051539]|uniref:mannose-1-phosphate guanylyltransferase n=1 Tax=Cryptosporangium sp. NPDC051539 TaxID=3363962 RepID=UPI0037B370B4